MKKTLTIIIALFGVFGGLRAQTLLYQWAFTNAADTSTNSMPSYAITFGTGNLTISNVVGDVDNTIGADGINPLVYFTNADFGPGFGPGVDATGAFVANGQGYNGGNAAIAIATNLNLGNLFQVTVTYWMRLDPSVAAQFPRFVQFAQTPAYDIGNKGSGNHSDIGASMNSSGGIIQEQNSVASATGAQGTATAVTGLSNFPNGLPADGVTWIFEAISYDGTLGNTNFITWLGTTNLSVEPIVYSANYGAINFTTNATVMIGGNDVPSAPRELATGGIADVRIYSGILTSNMVEQIRQFQAPSLVAQNLAPAGVITQPNSGSSFVGGDRSFSVLAQGTPATFTYLWRSNGVAIPGATSSTLNLSNLSLAANGASFVCSVSNVIGGTNSQPAILKVVQPQSGSYAQAVLENSPYSFWLVNEGSNYPTVSIFDYANGHDGVALDPTNTVFLGGPSGSFYPGFSSTNTAIEPQGNFLASRINLADPGTFNNAGMTICGWILTPGQPTANGLMFDLVSDTAGGFGLVFDGADTVSYQWGAAAPASGFFGPTFNPNEWTFVALVVGTNLTSNDMTNSITADTNATVYVGAPSIGLLNATDSTAIDGDTIGSGTSSSPFTLGRIASAASDNGSFYQANTVAFNSVAIFDSELSGQTITNLYLAGIGSFFPLVVGYDTNTPGNILLTYPMGTLQSTTNLLDPFTDVPDASNPWSVPTTGQAAFFRARP